MHNLKQLYNIRTIIYNDVYMVECTSEVFFAYALIFAKVEAINAYNFIYC